MERQKWVQKQARYRRRKKINMSKDCSTSYWSTGDGTSESGNIQQEHGVFGFKDDNSCTVTSVQTGSTKLQGEENLRQQVLFSHRLMNANQYPTKHKAPIADLPVTQTSKKKG